MDNSDADVAVVGLGAVGAMTLWRLAEQGVRAHGYERFGIAHDRGASAGQTRRFSVQSQRDPRFTPLAVEAIRLWRELEEFSGSELLRQTGGLILGPRETSAITTAAESAEQKALPFERVDEEGLRSRYPQHTVRNGDVGVTDPLAGYLRPEASVACAVARARHLGARTSLYTEVLAVTPRSNGVVVATRKGERLYERVVIAPGAWARQLVPGPGPLVVPRRVVQGWYLARRPEEFRPEVFGVFERVGDVDAYGFPSLDGTTIKIGIKFATHPEVHDLACVDRVVEPAFARRAASVVREFLPGLYPHPVNLQTGIEGYSPDDTPLLGPAPEDHRLVIACGFSGMGFKFSPVIGDIVAEFATSGSSSREVSFMAPGRPMAATAPARATEQSAGSSA